MKQPAGNPTYPLSNSLNSWAYLWWQGQFRSFDQTLRLIENSVRTCDLAILCSNLEQMSRCETRARRLCARIIVSWSLNVPLGCRQELKFHGERLKEAVRRLERFQKLGTARGVAAHTLEGNWNSKGGGANVPKTTKIIRFRKARNARA